jgi:PIN domain nuclease of toxin-antitoxin system
VARLVLDASVLIAYFNPLDAHHASAVARLRRASGDECIVIASALAEILVHPYRVGPEAVSEVEAALAALRMVVLPIDASLARRAAELRASNTRLRLGDALVIAAGDALDAEVVTADASWSRISRRVRVL